MISYRRIAILIILAVFATSTFADAIVMTKMSTDMASYEMKYIDTDMGECNNCLSESDNCGYCDSGCVTHLGTLFDTGSHQSFISVDSFSTDSPRNYTSNTGPPDPFPPRSSNLT